MNRRQFLAVTGGASLLEAAPTPKRHTKVSIQGDQFLLNGKLSYKGRFYKGMKIEGLLMNARVVQGIFDDLNPVTRDRWKYPDTGKWDPERNTNEFVAAMPEWRRNGLLAFTINLQGGTPNGGGGAGRGGSGGRQGFAGGSGGRGGGRAGSGGFPAVNLAQTLENTAIDPDGGLRDANMARLARILDRADELGMVAIVGYFYVGQEARIKDEAAVRRAILNVTNWLLERDYGNLLVEVANECNLFRVHDILKPARIDEAIKLVKSVQYNGRRLLAGTSWGGPTSSRPEGSDSPVTPNVVQASDFLLIHGNGPDDMGLLQRMIHDTRKISTYRTMPVLINEDPHYDFTAPNNFMLTAIKEYVSWGIYDQGNNNYIDGFQSPPVNWSINTERKKDFFALVKEVTGS